MPNARCPQCRQEIVERDTHFPFCSKRCKLLDLGAWASEKYRIAAVETDESEDAKPEQAEDGDPVLKVERS